MAINKNKINDNALKFVQKGQIKKAIKEYDKILAEDRGDVRTLLKKGDLLVRVGERDQAIETYLAVANAYSQQGFHLKAVAVFKQILKINENRIDVNLRLAEEYQNLGIAGDAMSHLQIVAAYYDQQGMVRESLDTLRRIVDLDPDNIASRIKLAELYSREDMTSEAVEEFRRATDELKAANRVEDFIKVAERLIFHDPSDIGRIKELSNIYLQRGDTKRALGKLQICFKADPNDLETLSMLAMSFQELGQLSKTVSVFKEMAKIYEEQGAVTEMQDVYRRVLEIAPDDPEAGQALGVDTAASQPAMVEASVEQVNPAVAMSTEPEFEPEFEPMEAEVYEPVAEDQIDQIDEMAVETHITEIQPESGQAAMHEQNREQISRLLTETDVYIKYGLHNKAYDHINNVFEIDPNNIEAHDKLKELYLTAGQNDHAAQELVTLVHLCALASRAADARTYLRSLLTLDPAHPDGPGLEAMLDQQAPVAGVEPVPGGEFAEVDLDAPDVLVTDMGVTVEVGSGDSLDSVDVALDFEEPAEFPSESEEYALDDQFTAPAVQTTEPSMDVIELDDEVGVAFGEADLGGLDFESIDEAAEQILAPSMEDYGVDDDTVELSQMETGKYDGEPGSYQPDAEVSSPVQAGDELAPDLSMPDDDQDVLHTSDGPVLVQEDPELIDFDSGEEDFFTEEADVLEDVDEFDAAEASTRLLPGMEEGQAEPPAAPAVEEEEEGEEEEELEDGLDEVEFFIQQNLLNEAADALESLKESFPDHPAVLEKEAKLERLQKGEAPVAQVTSEDLGESFDLAAEIEREVGDDINSAIDGEFQYSVDDVFSEFKKGVEKVVEKEDSATHFDLGIAYKEMGLIDDAINEFTVVSHDEGRRAGALSMIGLCLVEKGQYSEAINRFKDALHQPGISDQEATGLYFEMGSVYEQLDDLGEALFYFKKVYKRDPKFRNVIARLKALVKSAGGKKPPGGGGSKPSGSTGSSDGKDKISYM